MSQLLEYISKLAKLIYFPKFHVVGDAGDDLLSPDNKDCVFQRRIHLQAVEMRFL